MVNGHVKTDLTAVVALSDEERRSFFPEPLWSELRQLLPRLRLLSVPLSNEVAWREALLCEPPELMITGWEALRWPLPMELRRNSTRRLNYVCHVGGTVRPLVPRTMLTDGLLVSNWGHVANRVVAEAALLMILGALRRATFYALEMHQPQQDGWRGSRRDQQLCRSLIGRRVGLHGFGGVARALVPLLRPFQVTLHTFALNVSGKLPDFPDVQVCRDVEELFVTSEVLVELTAGVSGNRHIVTENLLRKLPMDAVFVNVARGLVVDEGALVRVAEEGRIQAALDVYEQEPLPADSPLRRCSNITLFPHMAGPTMDRRRDCGEWAVVNLRRYMQGEAPAAQITLEMYDSTT